ncbi:hypothetical protein GE061_016947 [Apolygus lucorum]|uniref:Uncharacterized protein n=1 Tax=Apolygus lucorum TaxID=248454 RepID=A0A8S9XIQ8_APOLU|nr:hypothetical protein GE061_016947 [Apolygus lucorum]
MSDIIDDTPGEELPKEVKPEDSTWYFVDDNIKDRIGGGDGPSFSVASLFSSKNDVFTKTEESEADPQPLSFPGSGPASIWKKDSLFILDSDDARIAGIGKFFDVRPTDINAKDLTNRRRGISLIVQNKFKRIERNQDKFKSGPSRFTNPRRNFKKQKT